MMKDIFKCDLINGGVASGTEIINQYVDLHRQTKKSIVYTSVDSVLQIACDVDIYDVNPLYYFCEQIMQRVSSEYIIGRVIVRPFDGSSTCYYRTKDRKDFKLPPSSNTVLNILENAEKEVIKVGKVDNIFSMSGVTKYYQPGQMTKEYKK